MSDSLPALARVHGRKFRHGSAPRSAPSSPPPPRRRGSLVSPSVLVGVRRVCLCGVRPYRPTAKPPKHHPQGARCASAHNNNIPSIFSYHIISYLIISNHIVPFAYDRIRPHTTAYDRTDFQQDKNDSFHLIGVPIVPTAAHPD